MAKKKKPKKKSGNESTVAKLAFITAILTLANNLISLILKLIELFTK